MPDTEEISGVYRLVSALTHYDRRCNHWDSSWGAITNLVCCKAGDDRRRRHSFQLITLGVGTLVRWWCSNLIDHRLIDVNGICCGDGNEGRAFPGMSAHQGAGIRHPDGNRF